MRAVAAQIMDVLRNEGLLMREWHRLVHVVVRPSNRFGLGLDPAAVHELLTLLLLQGWVWSEVAERLWAFQQMPGKKGVEQLKFNRDLVANAGGLLAPAGDDVRILTVAGSHTTNAAKVVGAEAKGIPATGKDDAGKELINYWSDNGHIDKGKVFSLCKPMQAVCEDKGLEYEVIRREVQDAMPNLPGFLSEAANKGHGTERENTRMALLLKAHKEIMQAGLEMEGEQWHKLVKGMAQKMRVPETESRDLCNFVLKWSGGQTPIYLQEMERFSKHLALKRVDIPANIFGALAKLKLSESPQYIVAVCEAMLTSPDQFVRGGFSTLMTTTDIAAITGKTLQPAVTAAADYMKRARVWMEGRKFTPETKTKKLGDLDVKCVMHVHGKRVRTRKQYESLSSLAVAWQADVMEGADIETEPPFPELDSDDEEAKAGPSGLLEFSATGITMGTLTHLGFITGATVKSENDEYILKALNNKKNIAILIPLRAAGSKEEPKPLRLSFNALHDRYHIVECKDVFHDVHNFPNPASQTTHLIELAKARVRAALAHLWDKHYENAAVRIRVRPGRAAFVPKGMEPEKLVLVPFTLTVAAVKKGSPLPTQALRLEEYSGCDVYLMPAFTAPVTKEMTDCKAKETPAFLVPFWCVRTTEDADKINMKFTILEAKGVRIPCLHNTHALKPNDELIALARDRAKNHFEDI